MKKIILILLLALPAFAARKFNGSSDVITVPGVSTPVDISTGPMTVSFWMMPSSGDLSGQHSIVTHWDASSDPDEQYWIGLGAQSIDKRISMYIGTYGLILGVYGSCPMDLVANTWYQVIVMVDPNGDFFGSPSAGMWIWSTAGNCSFSTSFRERRTAGGVNLLLGNETGGSFFYGGRLAEVAIWNSVLQIGDINSLAQVCPGNVHRTSQVFYAPLWGASGASIEPSLTGNTGLNGALTGTTVVNHAPCTP